MRLHKSILLTLTLFGSFTCMLCCALPALFVALGAGAALAGVVSAVPQLVWISAHKIGFFIFAGIMLIASALSRFLTRNAPCPSDPEEAEACIRLRKLSLGVFCFSLVLYATGFFFAFVAHHLA